MISPAGDDEFGRCHVPYQRLVVAWTYWIGRSLHDVRIASSKGKQVQHLHGIATISLGKTNAFSDGLVVRAFVRG